MYKYLIRANQNRKKALTLVLQFDECYLSIFFSNYSSSRFPSTSEYIFPPNIHIRYQSSPQKTRHIYDLPHWIHLIKDYSLRKQGKSYYSCWRNFLEMTWMIGSSRQRPTKYINCFPGVVLGVVGDVVVMTPEMY